MWNDHKALEILSRQFPDEEAAQLWFTQIRWPEGVKCIYCNSFDITLRSKPQPYRCRNCLKDFSVKTGTIMHGSNLCHQTWASAIVYMTRATTSIKLVDFAEVLGIMPRSALNLADRIREAWKRHQMKYNGVNHEKNCRSIQENHGDSEYQEERFRIVEPIPDRPRNVARAILGTPQRKRKPEH